MGSWPKSVSLLGGSKVVQIVRIETELPWRQQPVFADWMTPLIEAKCEKANATRNVRKRAMEFILDPKRAYYFDSEDLPGPTVTFGVSASHEAGATYLAFSNQPIAIDCCASDRAGEILSAGRVAFSEEEFAMLVSEESLVDGWCAVECLCKLWGAGILRPGARPHLITTKPMTAEGTEFGSIGSAEQDRTRRIVGVWATKTSETWKEGAA
jgi:hypothetical protein